jgi:argininosuccinate lyase
VSTGRITGELGRRTRRLIYGPLAPAEIDAELPLMMKVDQAHLVMLAEQKLISGEAARQLLAGIAALAADPAPLHGRPAPRGLYLMYEGYLIERLGADIGGVLHSGRSRNDLKATIAYLRFRAWLLEFAEQASRLEAILLARARAHESVVMPIYTHFQAAMPVSYGYYLLGVAVAVGREIEALTAAAEGLHRCPLGASAVAGTDLPIEPARTAALLGFAEPAGHALDAVASRDVPLRLLAAAASLSVTLSRLATDLQLWSTVEFGFIEFPDRLVGGSSAMPQKRNAFLLEHVKAKPGQALGAWAAAASSMAGTPFTNTIEVGTEATEAIWPGLAAAEQAVLLSQVLVSGARPQPARMAQRAETGLVAATTLANRLVQQGVPFRTAHRMVGEAVREAVASGSTQLPGFDDTDLTELVRALAYGGGPGAFTEPYQRACAAWEGHRRWHQRWRAALAGADDALAAAVRSLMDTP